MDIEQLDILHKHYPFLAFSGQVSIKTFLLIFYFLNIPSFVRVGPYKTELVYVFPP